MSKMESVRTLKW